MCVCVCGGGGGGGGGQCNIISSKAAANNAGWGSVIT